MANFAEPPQIDSIGRLFESCFSIPIFQRPYSWGKEEIDELFNDIRNYFYNRKDEDLYIGTIYLSQNSKIHTSLTRYDLVDGQQRTTTLAITLLVLYHYAVQLKLTNDHSVERIKAILWKYNYDKREYDRNLPLLTSNGIEKDVISSVFDTIYSQAGDEKCIDNIINLQCDNVLEQRVTENVKYINDNLLSIFYDEDEEVRKATFLRLVDFIIDNLKFITIIVNDIKKLFEIFESINGKGKKLEEIDLIKSYIFQNIEEQDYTIYLNKWGELIKDTNDNLEDYMNVFIRAYIKYYRNNINAKYFRNLANDFMAFYKKDNLSDALKALLDDMIAKKQSYQKINDKDACKYPNKREFVFYSKCLELQDYKHPRPLLFRTYCEVEDGNIAYDDVLKVFKASFVYMFTFQTIAKRDSKDAIDVFEDIMKNIYKNGFNTKTILDKFKNSFIDKGINSDIIKDNIRSFSSYTDAGRILLIAYEFSNNNKILYDESIDILNNSRYVQIDHILPQYPDEAEPKFYYYCDKSTPNEKLKLKDGNDFDQEHGIYDGMEYELFKSQVLCRIGNLKLLWSNKNRDKSNKLVTLPGYDEFHTYTQIKNRTEDIINELSENEIFTLPS